MRKLTALTTFSFLFAVCFVSFSAQAGNINGRETAVLSKTGIYVFESDKSTVVQTGGIAGVHRTYVIEGRLLLSVDPNAGTASFVKVDANAIDDSQYKRTLDPNEVFNITGLVGIVIDDVMIVFTGKASEGSDVLIIAILNNDLMYLFAQTLPPAGSADFFIFNMDAIAQRKYSGGSGMADDPYQITTAADLIALGDSPEDYDKHFILTADIDLDPNLPGRKVFDKAVIVPDTDPLRYGCQGALFSGVFDGNGHKIWHLTISGGEFIGLFGALNSGAEVRDLGVVDVNITGSGDYVGSLVAFIKSGAVTQCYCTGLISGDHSVGGLVGYNDGAVTKCYSASAVSGGHNVGGLVGWNWDRVIQCYSTGAVSGNDAVGGLVGRNGMFGHTDYPGYIDKSYSIASVRGEIFVGGLVGWNLGPVTQCYSTGAVIGTGESIGGLVGGGWSPDMTTSFWDIETSGQATSAGGTGKTTAEMQTASTLLKAGWDFVNETKNGTEDIWWILEGQDYPRLYWELIDDD